MKNTIEKISTHISPATMLDLDGNTQNELIKKAISNAAYTQAKYGMPIEIADEISRNAQEHVSAVWSDFFTAADELTLQNVANNYVKNMRHNRIQTEKRFISYDNNETQTYENETMYIETFADANALDPFKMVEIESDIMIAIDQYCNRSGNSKLDANAAKVYAAKILEGVYPVKAMHLANIGRTARKNIDSIIFEYYKS